MRLLLISVCLTTAWLATGCAPKSSVTVLSSPYSDGGEHTEPVFFTGRHYDLTFRFDAGDAAYHVNVKGRDTAFSGSEKDGETAKQIVASALSHFACPTKQRAAVMPGTARHDAGSWVMKARCGVA